MSFYFGAIAVDAQLGKIRGCFMNEQQLQNVDPSDAEAVKAAQLFLKAQGFYAGAIDGKWGDNTVAARRAFGEAMQRQQQMALQQAEAETRTAEAQREQTQIENDPVRQLGPFGGGFATGTGLSYLVGRGLRSGDAAMRDAGSRLAAAERIAPAVAENELARMARGRNIRYGGQFLIPAAAFGAGQFTREYIAPQMESESARDWAKRAANFETGIGTGGTLMGIKNLVSGRSSPVDPIDRATVASRAAIARNPEMAAAPVAFRATQPPRPVVAEPEILAPQKQIAAPRAAVPASAPTAATVVPQQALPNPEATGRTYSDRLISAAKAGGASVKTKKQAANWLNRNVAFLPAKERAAIATELGVNRGPKFVPRLKEAVSNMASKTGRFGILAPLAGAAVGWEMAGDEAQASTGGGADMSVLRRKAEGAAIGGGAAGGAAYGMRKLAETPVGQAISKSAIGLSGAVSPMMIDAMTDYTPEEKETGRQFLARNLPNWAQSDPIRAAGAREQMGMTPEKTDAAFEDALAQFEASRMQREAEPDASPLRQLTSGPATPAQFMARRYR